MCKNTEENVRKQNVNLFAWLTFKMTKLHTRTLAVILYTLIIHTESRTKFTLLPRSVLVRFKRKTEFASNKIA